MVCVAKQLCRLKIQRRARFAVLSVREIPQLFRINCALPLIDKHREVMVKPRGGGEGGDGVSFSP